MTTTVHNSLSEVVRRPSPTLTHQELVNEYFERVSAYWRDIYDEQGLDATLYRERKARVLLFADRLNLPPLSQVLEVGCGAGHTTVELAKRGYHVQATDAVPVMINRTQIQAFAAGVGERVEARPGDVHRLHFQSDRFSLVLAVGVLPWLESPLGPLREMARVTKRGGHLILTVDNRWRLNHFFDPRCFPLLRGLRRRIHDALEDLGLMNRGPNVPRHALYSVNQFDAMLAREGLVKIAGATLGFGPFTFMNCKLFTETISIKIHHRLQSLADSKVPVLRSAGVEYIVLARKR
jgi:SAM-dependent methyltransferase